MTIAFTINENDLLAYRVFSLKSNRRVRRRIQIMSIVLGPIYAFLGLYQWNGGHKAMGVAFIGFGVLTLLFYGKLYFWFSTRRMRRDVQKGMAHKIGQQATLQLGKKKIKVSDEDGNAEVEASAFSQVVSTSSHYFLQLNSNQGISLNKGDVQDQAGFEGKLKGMGIAVVGRL